MRKKHLNFFILITQCISLIISASIQFVLIWFLALESSSALVLALAGLISILPQFFFGHMISIWIERFKKKIVIIIADLLISLLSIILIFYFEMEQKSIFILLMILGIKDFFMAFHTPAFEVLIFDLLPKRENLTSNFWLQFIGASIYVVSPVIGSIMYNSFEMKTILLIDVLTSVIATIMLFFIKIKNDKPIKITEKTFFRKLKQGIEIYKKNKVLMSFLITSFITMLFFMPLSTYFPLIISSYFHLESGYESLVEVLFAVGMILATFLMTKFKFIKRIKLIYFSLFAIGITILSAGLITKFTYPFYFLFAFIALLMGASSNIYGSFLAFYMHNKLTEEQITNAYALWDSAISITFPLGLIISAPFCEKYGILNWYFVAGLVIIITTIFNYLKVKKYVNRKNSSLLIQKVRG